MDFRERPQFLLAGGLTIAAGGARRVVEWIEHCEVTWIACAMPEEATDLEGDMRREFRSHLTQR